MNINQGFDQNRDWEAMRLRCLDIVATTLKLGEAYKFGRHPSRVKVARQLQREVNELVVDVERQVEGEREIRPAPATVPGDQI